MCPGEIQWEKYIKKWDAAARSHIRADEIEIAQPEFSPRRPTIKRDELTPQRFTVAG